MHHTTAYCTMSIAVHMRPAQQWPVDLRQLCFARTSNASTALKQSIEVKKAKMLFTINQKPRDPLALGNSLETNGSHGF